MKGTQTIVIDYALAEPPSHVWRALTDPELLGRWLMPNDIAPIVGHKFLFQTQPMGDWDGKVYSEVLEVIPLTKLVYTWKSGDADSEKPGSPLDTVVTWTLAPTVEGGTTLHLVHEGFEAGDFGYEAMAGGWKQKGPSISAAITDLPREPDCK